MINGQEHMWTFDTDLDSKDISFEAMCSVSELMAASSKCFLCRVRAAPSDSRAGDPGRWYEIVA